MSFQKRLVATFRTFVEKVFLPQCSKNEAIMSDWSKFVSMLSSENLNINEIQMYVDSIGPQSTQVNLLLMQSQQSMPSMAVSKKQQFYNHSSVYNRKKQQQLGYQPSVPEMSFNPNKTFGGQKVKLPMYNSTNNNANNKQQIEELSRKQQQQFANNNNSSSMNNQGNGTNPSNNAQSMKDDMAKFRTSTPNMTSMYKETSIDNAPVMLASLQKLYKSLVENQQKIQSLTQVSSQMVGGTVIGGGSQGYY